MITPSLNLDFVSASLDSRITFARALNTASRVNSSGLFEVVNADVPRFDYDPLTLVCRGLLVEESRINIMPTSNVFTGWTNSGATVSASTETSPDGTTNATLVTGVSGNLRIHRLLTGLSNTSTYSFSWFAKAGTSNTITIDFVNVANGPVFNFSTGNWGASGAWVVGRKAFPNGWWLLTASLACNTTTAGPGFRVASAGATVHIYQCQIEVGTFPTSIIPNAGASPVTRNADVATITGTNFSGWWQASKGGVLVRARPGTVSGVRPWVQFDDGTADNIIALRGNTTNPELYIKATTDQAAIDAGAIAANTSYRLAGTWATNDCAASINSGTPVLDTSATIPAVTQMRIGSDGTNYLNGHIEAIEYYDQRLLDASMQVVSSPAGYRSIIGPVMRDTIIR
jgi:hypothetical protein